ncbi:MAG: hypothetical protein CMJ94_01805 [Planctomycetes bacterium]|nr:hypothetical protein [Planctomycetota bacterium]
MRSWLLGLLALATPFLADEPEVPEDVVHFAKGRPQEGVLVRNDSSGVWLAQKSKVRHYEVSEVVKVEGPRAAYPEYLERMRAEFNEQPDADRCVELAKWCEENGLTRDAQLYYWRALLDNPTHDAAHEGLGHRKSRGLYRIPVKGHGKLSVQELREVRASDFDDCWELTTMHFKVEAAGDLPDVLAACADLEMVYSAFFKEFQETVGFWDLREPLRVRIYPTLDDMPPASGTVEAYFHDSTRTVYTYFRDGVAQELVHEGIHAILYGAVREFARNDPATPGWLDEGIAEYMEHHLIGNPGDRKLVREPIHLPSLEAQLDHDRPDSIQRVLNYQKSDYYASTDQELKYAQSYSLFYFLIHSGDDDLRDGMNRFLASVFERKGSSSHFKDAMEIRDWDDFEERWIAYLEERRAAAKEAAEKAQAGG